MPGGSTLAMQPTDAEIDALVDEAIAHLARAGSCVLDEVDRRGDHTLETIGHALNVTRERIRQIETKSAPKFRKNARCALGSATERPTGARRGVVQGFDEV